MADFLPSLDLISCDRGVGDECAHGDGRRDLGRSLHGADGRLLLGVVAGPGADVADQIGVGLKIGVLPPGPRGYSIETSPSMLLARVIAQTQRDPRAA